MDIGPILKSPYLETFTTPARWIGNTVAKVVSPYFKTAEHARQKSFHPNPVLNYLKAAVDHDNPAVEPMGAFLVIPGFVGIVGGSMIGGFAAQAMLAGAALPLQIVGGIGIMSASVALSVAAAPVAFALGLAGATLVAAASVMGVPGMVTGLVKTASHVFGGRKPPAPPPLPAKGDAGLASIFSEGARPKPRELAEYIAALPPKEKTAVFDSLRELSLDDFGEAAALERPVAPAKTASFTRAAKPAVAVTP